MSSADVPNLRFCVFSFNRGPFLKHCIESIEFCAPSCSITVFDDSSTDPETVDILAELGKRHTVMVCDPERNSKHGGLTANMQQALDDLDDDDYVCSMQDDMQMVRPPLADDLTEIANYFETDNARGFLHPAFLKGNQRYRDLAGTLYYEQAGVYYRADSGASVGVYYADVSIYRVSRLRGAGWRFRDRESANEIQAREKFTKMGFMLNPFIMWLPSVPVWRGRIQTRSLMMAQKRQGCGFHPFDIMEEEESRMFRNREQAVFPVAEDFLTLKIQQGDSLIENQKLLKQPWKYHPLQGQRLLKLTHRIELLMQNAR